MGWPPVSLTLSLSLNGVQRVRVWERDHSNLIFISVEAIDSFELKTCNSPIYQAFYSVVFQLIFLVFSTGFAVHPGLTYCGYCLFKSSCNDVLAALSVASPVKAFIIYDTDSDMKTLTIHSEPQGSHGVKHVHMFQSWNGDPMTSDFPCSNSVIYLASVS